MLLKNIFKKQIISVFALKLLHQVVYTFFCFFAIKKFNIEDFGLLSYILAIIGYFPSFALLGLPVYLQKQIAHKQEINLHYLLVASTLTILLLVGIHFILPTKIYHLRTLIIFITFTNIFMTILTAINNGKAYYSNEYKFLLMSCCWMPVIILFSVFSERNWELNRIFYFWSLNCVIMFIYFLYFTLQIYKHIRFSRENVAIYSIIINLILFYALFVPFDFPRFYDRFLLDKFFDHTTLGIYAFNSTLVIMVYALFVRPLTNIYITLLTQNLENIEQQAKILTRYYLHILIIYSLLLILYAPFSQQWLSFTGLTRYGNTVVVFFFSLLNMVLFNLSIPLQIRICLSNDLKKKLIYFSSSLLIFNIPFFFIFLHRSFLFFLIGFTLAYLSHLSTCIFLDFTKTVKILKLIPREFNNLFTKVYTLIFALR